MRTVAFVPVKLNNERLPNKNTKSFDNGKPLIFYILDTLKKVKSIDKVFVYCSNEEIFNYMPTGINFIKRSKTLDTSDTKINEVIAAFVKDVDSDIYILAHATSPFIKCESIEKGLSNVLNKGYDSAFAVRKVQEFLWKDSNPLNYDPSSIPRTQDLEVIFSETSGVYIFNKDLITNNNRRIGFNPYLIEVSKIEGIDIDDQEDFEIANAIFNYRKG